MNFEKNCICFIRTKDNFRGSKDFFHFEDYVSNNDNFREITPRHQIYSRFWHKNAQQDDDVTLGEKWYECTACKKIWRLVTPDPPFAGVWEPVEDINNPSD